MNNALTAKHVQVCLLTYCRPQLLRLALESLLLQSAAADVVMHILVVDNHDGQSGRPVFDEVLGGGVLGHGLQNSIDARYVAEPARGLASARNRALNESAGMDFVAFIDDDEVADPDWLSRLLQAAEDFNADVTTGPVWPRYVDSPEWVVRGGFFEARQRPTGTAIEFVATNNTLLRGNVVFAFRFDKQFDTNGGEDTEFFMRIKRAGHRMVWVNEAIVSEIVPPERANFRWLLNRARSDAYRHTRACLSVYGGPQAVARRFVIACGGFLVGLVRLPSGILGRHHAVRALQLMSRSVGTFSALCGSKLAYYKPVVESVQKLRSGA